MHGFEPETTVGDRFLTGAALIWHRFATGGNSNGEY